MKPLDLLQFSSPYQLKDNSIDPSVLLYLLAVPLMSKHQQRVGNPSNSSSSRIAMLTEPDVYRHPAFLSYREPQQQEPIYLQTKLTGCGGSLMQILTQGC